MSKLRQYFQQRGPLLGAAALLGVSCSALSPKSGPDDVEGLLESISATSTLKVKGIAWEPSHGWFSDLVLGRGLLFEGSSAEEAETAQTGDEQRDIYRCFVRLSPEGSVLDVSRAKNLTRTRLSDENQLKTLGNVALFSAQGEHAGASVTLLDLRGEESGDVSWLDRVQLGVARFMETGSWSGLGRSDILGTNEGSSFELTLNGEEAEILTGDGRAQKALRLPRKALFQAPQLGKPSLAEALPKELLTLNKKERQPLPWSHFAANIGRDLFGSEVVAWTEGRLFALWDNIHRAGYEVSHAGGDKRAVPQALVVSAIQDDEDGIWPPLPIVLPADAKAGDGQWKAVKSSVLPGRSEPLFYRTLLHPDPKRPYAELHLVAMDMRRLELGMRAGYEDPEPDTGPPGSGSLPPDPALSSRVVATFNGAFKATHGRYGMKAEGRLLVEPVPGAATVFVDDNGEAVFGDYDQETVENEVGEPRSFRQNLDPLVADGQVNPKQRKVWGDHLYGSGVAIERSALCLHQSGQLVYAWATQATGSSLAEGLALSGCVYAIHLDMNPGHCAFLFNDVESVTPLKARGETLDPRMRVNETRFVRWSPKDFFYVAERGQPPADDSISWTAADGAQPAPTSVPAIIFGKKTLGDLEIELDRVEAGRLEFVMNPGRAESKSTDLGLSLNEAEAGRALIAWGLGHQTRGSRTGLSLGTQVLVPMSRSYATLQLEEGEAPRLLPPSEASTETRTEQLIQFPLLARDGELLPAARELGGRRMRSALCIDPSGNLYVGRMNHDTPAPLVQTLLDQGCSLVASMDRGSHAPPLVERAGTESPPHQGYEQSLLYGLARTMKPRTRLLVDKSE